MVKPRSTFHQALVEKLDRPFAWIPFIWSGANSFHARNAAAEELVMYGVRPRRSAEIQTETLPAHAGPHTPG
jgi:hypothetical protein